ncbi:MAG: hypothetical protein H0U66_15160 [Gemmatimonadaceae bacterium]|nr:hypothetical protein [Gemmatimonadaceae bacterium]
MTTPSVMIPQTGLSFAAKVGFDMVFGTPGFASLFTGSYDRAIGMYHGGPNAPQVLPRRAVVITREQVENAIGKKRDTSRSQKTLAQKMEEAAEAQRAASNAVASSSAGGGAPSAGGGPNGAASGAATNGGLPWGTIMIPLVDGSDPDLQGR